MAARCYPAELEPIDGRRGEWQVWDQLRRELPDGLTMVHGVKVPSGPDGREIAFLIAWPGVGVAVIEVKGGAVSCNDADRWWSSRGGSGQADREPDGAGGERSARARAFPGGQAVAGGTGPDAAPRGAAAHRRPTGLRPLGVPAGPGRRQGRSPAAGAPDPAAGRVGFGPHAVLGRGRPGADRVVPAAARAGRSGRRGRARAAVGPAGDAAGGCPGPAEPAAALHDHRRCRNRQDRARPGAGPAVGAGRQAGRAGLLLPRAGTVPAGGSDYYEEQLPRFLGEAARGRPDLFDAVVVDEAQDFGDLWWPSLLECLRDKENGGVFVFMDEDQRVFQRRGAAPDRPGCRAGRRCGRRAAGPVGAAADRPAHHQHRHPEHVAQVERHGPVAYWDGYFADEDIFFSSVSAFKGLERTCVVLAVNGFSAEARAKEMLYVGLSRARSQLVVCGDLDEIARYGGAGVRKRLLAAEQWATTSLD